jgi:hypothetical protein
VAALAACPVTAAPDRSWLVGTWELTYDPAGGEKDWMEFTDDGQAFSIAPNHKRVAGNYVVTDREVRVTYKIKGKLILHTLTFTPDRKKLLGSSAKSGHNSVYERVK